jgi:hypothetical protein
VIPDGIEPVVGYRCWTLQGGFLKPTNSDFLWQPGDNEAICYADQEEFKKSVGRNVNGEFKIVEQGTHGLIPEATCNCGFWMLKTPQNLLDRMIAPKRDVMSFAVMASAYFGQYEPRQYVLGQVRGWGRVLPGENGWRTEFAAVELIIQVEHWDNVINDDRLEAVAKLYDVPVVREEAFDGQPPPTEKEKALERKKARKNYTFLNDIASSAAVFK